MKAAALLFLIVAGSSGVPDACTLPLHMSAQDIEMVRNGIPIATSSTNNVVSGPNYVTAVGRLSGRSGRAELHRQSARLFVVTSGRGQMRIGGEIGGSDDFAGDDFIAPADAIYSKFEIAELETGSVVHIPAGTPYQLVADNGDMHFLVTRIYTNLDREICN